MTTHWAKLASNDQHKAAILASMGLTEASFVGWVSLAYPPTGKLEYTDFEEAAKAADENGVNFAHRDYLVKPKKARVYFDTPTTKV